MCFCFCSRVQLIDMPLNVDVRPYVIPWVSSRNVSGMHVKRALTTAIHAEAIDRQTLAAI
jgi:hypothetical protein